MPELMAWIEIVRGEKQHRQSTKKSRPLTWYAMYLPNHLTASAKRQWSHQTLVCSVLATLNTEPPAEAAEDLQGASLFWYKCSINQVVKLYRIGPLQKITWTHQWLLTLTIKTILTHFLPQTQSPVPRPACQCCTQAQKMSFPGWNKTGFHSGCHVELPMRCRKRPCWWYGARCLCLSADRPAGCHCLLQLHPWLPGRH